MQALNEEACPSSNESSCLGEGPGDLKRTIFHPSEKTGHLRPLCLNKEGVVPQQGRTLEKKKKYLCRSKVTLAGEEKKGP